MRSPPAVGKIDQHVGQVDECRRLGSDRRFLVGGGFEKIIGAPSAPRQHQKTRTANDHPFQRRQLQLQLEFEFRCRCGFFAFAFRLLVFFDVRLFRLGCHE